VRSILDGPMASVVSLRPHLAADPAAAGSTALERVAQLTKPIVRADELLHPVDARLQAVLPWAGVKKGSVIETRSRALGWLLVAEAAKLGSWVAAVGVPSPSWAAAAELGVPLDRIAVISTPPVEVAGTVLAALADAVEFVLVDPSVNIRPHELRRLIARVRERRGVLVSFGEVGAAWEGVDVRLSVTQSRWHGLGNGHGALTGREVDVHAVGRGAAMRPRNTTMWLQGTPERWADPTNVEVSEDREVAEVRQQEVRTAASA
jgi:hypothetical protein